MSGLRSTEELEILDLDAVLSLVFEGSETSIRRRLGPLSSSARSCSFRQASKTLASLRRCCRRYDEVPRVTHAELEAAARARAPGLGKLRIGDGSLFVRIQAVWVGLADRSKIAAGLKRDDNVEWSRSMVREVGAVLLDRPEEWAEEVLLEWFENLDRWTAGSHGALEFLRQLVEERPERRKTFEPFFGRRAAMEGFGPRQLRTLPPYLLIAGLLDDAAAILTEWEIYPRIVGHFKAGKIPRTLLYVTTLEKLRMPMRQGLERAWLDLLKVIEPTEAEREQQQELYEDLLVAASAAPARLGLEEVERRWPSLAEDTEAARRILGLLVIALEHAVQAVAKRAFRNVKKILKAQPSLHGQAIGAILQALATPHAALRKDVLAFLKRSDPALFSAEHLALLGLLAADLDLEQRAMIEPLLPSPQDSCAGEPMTVEEPRLAVDIDEVLARTARHGAALGPAQRRWVRWLESYGRVGTLPSAADTPAETLAITPLASVEDMLELLSEPGEHGFSAVERERLLDGASRFALDEEMKARVQRLFDPVMKRVENADFSVYARDRFILLIVHAWTGAKLPEIIATEDVDAQAALWLASKDFTDTSSLMPQAPSLSSMTEASGALDSVIFVRRWISRGRVSAIDLERALYRLRPGDERRLEAWALVAEASLTEGPLAEAEAESADQGQVRLEHALDLIRLALAPEAEAKGALARLIAALPEPGRSESEAYDDMLDLVVDAFAIDGEGTDAEAREAMKAEYEKKAAIYRQIQTRGLAFRLIIAALRGRFGLGDARDICSTRDLEQLRRHFPISMGYRSDHEAEVRSFLFERLLFPSPVLADNTPEDFVLVDVGSVIEWPVLMPYIMAARARSGSSQTVDRAVSLFPPIGQRFFEAGLARRDQALEFKASLGSGGELAFVLFEAARAGHVEIAGQLSEFVPVLAGKFTQNRERAIDLVLLWLQDSRVAPGELAAALSGLLAATSKGGKFVDQALESISVAGDGAARTVHLALENVIVESFDELAPRSRTMVLDRLLAVLEALADGVRDPATRERLEELAAAKKSSAVRDRARRLVRRPSSSDLPLAIESVADLLSASLPVDVR